jgi:ribulose kinase
MTVACKKIDKLTHFYLNYQTRVTIEQTDISGISFDVRSSIIPTNSDSIFTAQHTSADHVNQIILKQVSLFIVNTDSIQPGTIQSIEIYVLGEGSSDKLIAWTYHITNEMYAPFILSTTTDDLIDYLKKPQIQYRIHGELSGDQVFNIILNIETQYFSSATIVSER